MEEMNSTYADTFNINEYRLFILRLSRFVTTHDMEELKYATEIPRGIAERLTTPLDVFQYLESAGLMGSENLNDLERLFILMEKYYLSRMVRTFKEERRQSDFSTFANDALG